MAPTTEESRRDDEKETGRVEAFSDDFGHVGRCLSGFGDFLRLRHPHVWR